MPYTNILLTWTLATFKGVCLNQLQLLTTNLAPSRSLHPQTATPTPRISHYTDRFSCITCRCTNSLCGRYSQNILLNAEATVFTDDIYIVEVRAIMATGCASVRKFLCEVPRTAREDKIAAFVV